MRVAIIGSRTLKQQEVVKAIEAYANSMPVTHIVTGGANGVDAMAEYYAKQGGLALTVYMPQYATHGKRAPLVRNNVILENCDAMLAVWDGQSKGTAYTIGRAKKLGIPTTVVRMEPAKPYHDTLWQHNGGRLPAVKEAIAR